MNIFQQIAKRYSSDTPKFWKKVMWFGGVLGTVSAGLLVVPDGVNVPAVLQNIAGYMATGSYVLLLIAGAATKDQNLSEQ